MMEPTSSVADGFVVRCPARCQHLRFSWPHCVEYGKLPRVANPCAGARRAAGACWFVMEGWPGHVSLSRPHNRVGCWPQTGSSASHWKLHGAGCVITGPWHPQLLTHSLRCISFASTHPIPRYGGAQLTTHLYIPTDQTIEVLQLRNSGQALTQPQIGDVVIAKVLYSIGHRSSRHRE